MPARPAPDRRCARPACGHAPAATLVFRYDTREVWIESLREEPSPDAYDLCRAHAGRTRPPSGWRLVDRRPRRRDATAGAVSDVPEVPGAPQVPGAVDAPPPAPPPPSERGPTPAQAW